MEHKRHLPKALCGCDGTGLVMQEMSSGSSGRCSRCTHDFPEHVGDGGTRVPLGGKEMPCLSCRGQVRWRIGWLMGVFLAVVEGGGRGCTGASPKINSAPAPAFCRVK